MSVKEATPSDICSKLQEVQRVSKWRGVFSHLTAFKVVELARSSVATKHKNTEMSNQTMD